MSIPEELLMAYADGELNAIENAAERAKVEAAMKADPEVARRIERHKALRKRMSATFDRVLDEPVPDRLVAAVRSPGTTAKAPDASNAARGAGAQSAADAASTQTSVVTDLNRVRAERAATSGAQAPKARAGWSWPQWGAMAASLVIGAVIGHLALRSPDLGPIGSRGGHLVAQAGLADALSNQLASTQQPTAPVQIGTSFKTKSGDYCRTFVLHEGDSVGGLACRSGDMWNVNALARVTAAPGAEGGYRPAGSEMPAAVRAAVEEQIVGDPLDSSGEAQAKTNGWK
jgi:hypothetical protein